MLKGLNYFLAFAFRHRKSYPAAKCLSELSKVLRSLAQIVLPGFFLNELFGDKRIGYLLLWLGIFLGIHLAAGLAQGAFERIAADSLDLLRGDFETMLLEKQVRCDYGQFEMPGYQNQRNRARQFVMGSRNRFGEILERAFSLFGHVFTLAGVVCVIAVLDAKVVFIFCALAGINTWVGTLLKKRRLRMMSDFAPILRRRGYFEDVAKNPVFAKEIRVQGIKGWILEHYDHYMDIFCGKTVPIHRYDMIQKITGACTGLVQNAVAYGYLFWKVLAEGMKLGQFTVYLNAINTFNAEMNQIIDTFLEISRLASFYQDFEGYISCRESLRTGSMESVPQDGWRGDEIAFCNVSFRYPGQDRDTLHNVSVKIHAGEKISIVGENGAGKTTFIKLLVRLYRPTEGKILWNGIDIGELDYDFYMRAFSVVFQDFKLFQMTLRENICMAEEEDKSRIAEALRVMGLDGKTSGLEKGLDTQVYKEFDKDGIGLSGGEAQRLALCRAYYKGGRFLVLDEPTAALDPRAEAEIYKDFRSLSEGRTTLFISHRLAFSRQCDTVLVFRKGEIVEQGNHAELMAKGGLYRELFDMQAGSFVTAGAD